MGFRIPSLFDILVFFIQSLGVGLISATFSKFIFQKTKPTLKGMQLNALSALIGPAVVVFIVTFIGAFPDIPEIIGSFFTAMILVVMGLPIIWLLLILESLVMPIIKPLHLVLMTLIIAIIIWIFFPFQFITEMRKCKQESCRTSPNECINGFTRNKQPCVEVNELD